MGNARIRLWLLIGLLLGSNLVNFWKIKSLKQELQKSQAGYEELSGKLLTQVYDLQGEVKALEHKREVLQSVPVSENNGSLSENQGTGQNNKMSQPAARRDAQILAKENATTWRTREALGDIEEELALTPEQKQALSDKLLDFFEHSGKSFGSEEFVHAREQMLQEVLGPESVSELYKREAQTRDREFQEQIGQEVVVLSRKLSLSASQEDAAKAALIQIEHQMIPDQQQIQQKMREAMATHFEGEGAKESLQTQYDEIKKLREGVQQKRNQALFSILENTLSDQQKNDLLAYQASMKKQ